MQTRCERLWIANQGVGGKLRYLLLSGLFLAAILMHGCPLFDSDYMADIELERTRPGHKILTPEILKQQIQSLEKELESVTGKIDKYNTEMAITGDPGTRAELSAKLTHLGRANLRTQSELFSSKKLLQEMTSVGTCFTADMLVLTENGAKPIGEIRAGDRVLSLDSGGRHVAAEVLNTLADRNNHYFLINGRIKVTGTHRFFTDQGWKRTNELSRGDRIQNTAGVFEKIDSIEWMPTEDLAVFNLTIAENHNFFVSPDGKSGYLVHNSGGGGK